jgi:NAD+ synthase (glutamine-hydrolysing)
MKKIALAQLDVKLGEPEKNVIRMYEMMREAKQHGADIIAFPEMCVGGYLLADYYTDTAICLDLIHYNKLITDMATEIGIITVWGNISIDSSNNGEDGREAKYNSIYCAHSGKMDVRNKTLLPNYRIFDDKRYFKSDGLTGLEPIVLEDGFFLAVEACEDIWDTDYSIKPTQELIDDGADIIINISASPFSVDKYRARDNCIKRVKKSVGEYFVPFFYVNCCGVQNNGKNIITFDGDSRIYNEKGEKQSIFLNPYKEGIIYADVEKVDDKYILMQDTKGSIEEVFSPIEQKFNAIIRSYKYIDELMGGTTFVFGLSGGVDSCLSAALCKLAGCKALGYNLPSKYNTQLTKDAAELFAYQADIPYETIPIEKLVKATEETLDDYRPKNMRPFKSPKMFYPEITDFMWENIQARIRGSSILATLAAIYNGVMVNNGNKVEIAAGYCTLYGDTNGVFAPLGDLTKIEIFEMCRFINRKFGHIIPEKILPDEHMEFVVPPTAELKEKQVDPFFWGIDDIILEKLLDYKRTDPAGILATYIADWKLCAKTLGINEELFKRYSLDYTQDNKQEYCKKFAAHLDWFLTLVRRGVFKRIQMPPIVLLSKSAFGYDYREAQFPYWPTQIYKELRDAILEEK